MKEALYRKRKVLHLVSQWSALYRDFLRDDEQVKLFMKVRKQGGKGRRGEERKGKQGGERKGGTYTAGRGMGERGRGCGRKLKFR